MKKILFCLQAMALGGVEKELITVLKKIQDQFDVTLLVLYKDDESVLAEVPESVKIVSLDIDKNYYCSGMAGLVSQRIKKGKIIEATSMLTKRLLGIGLSAANTNIDGISELEGMYDVAICYHIHSPLMLKYTALKVKAKKKIGWIHNDFYASGYKIQRLKTYVSAYDEFVAVSKKVEDEFRQSCPWYQGGVSTAYNYMDDQEIVERSEDPVDEEIFLAEKEVKLLTVGRFTEQKGIDMAIEVAAMLKKEKVKFHWFLIGHGELEATFRRLIQKFSVADCFTILGRKTNPYPFIKNCDIYVQPSRHEAFGLAVKEAKILKKPIVCTNFNGADEQIENGKNGIIVPVNDPVALCNALGDLINSPEARKALTKSLECWQVEDDLKEIVKHFS